MLFLNQSMGLAGSKRMPKVTMIQANVEPIVKR